MVSENMVILMMTERQAAYEQQNSTTTEANEDGRGSGCRTASVLG